MCQETVCVFSHCIFQNVQTHNSFDYPSGTIVLKKALEINVLILPVAYFQHHVEPFKSSTVSALHSGVIQNLVVCFQWPADILQIVKYTFQFFYLSMGLEALQSSAVR